MSRLAIAAEDLEVTNLDKVFYPATSFTKGDVLRYYAGIAPVMIPHLERRPVTVKRYPEGVEGLFFYEKRCPARRPAWLKTTAVTSDRHGSITFCTVDDARSLLWLANRAAIEFHPYLFRAGQELRPTLLVFDLDPGPPASLLDCLEIGMAVREVLTRLGLTCFAKTSGGKGLHLAVPVQGATFAATKGFAHGVADLMAKRLPERVTAVMAKAARTGKVFIDWSQNDHGKTTACAYTLRARSEPTVSTPVSWAEIGAALRRRQTKGLVFTADQVLERVRTQGDLFAEVLTLRQRLPPLA